jgi:hypothetical protein
MLAAVLFVLPSVTFAGPWLNAQITGQIRAHINHSFVIGNTTLPPGDYVFQYLADSDLSVMTANSENDKTTVVFAVETVTDNHMPNHSEIVFRKYGNTEFLDKIFEVGSKAGAKVTEVGREEQAFIKQGQQAMEHSEEQR